jgi:hypothetical protein
MRNFLGSILVTALGLGIVFYKGGWEPFFICVVLAVMEVSISLDNAVVNAAVLKNMDQFWRKMFLTLGMLIAVFGMRLILPIWIVAMALGSKLTATVDMALNRPEEYGQALHACELSIASFGGMFLLLVFLQFIFDHERNIHWLKPIERRLCKAGKLDTVEVVVALCCLLVYVGYVPEEKKFTCLVAGAIGVIGFLLLDGIKSLAANTGSAAGGAAVAKSAMRAGLGGFIYLEVLDASFSLDGVVGAFALSKNVLVIMIGLAIGAMFVRSLTIYMVEKGTLDQLQYLEHGAMWAIGALAGMMLIGALPGMRIPEWITGLSGAILITVAVISSIREKKRGIVTAPPK